MAWEVDLSLCDGLVAVSAPPAVWTIRRHHMWKAFALNGFGVAGGGGHEEVVAPEVVRCDCGHFFSTSAAHDLLPDAWHAGGAACGAVGAHGRTGGLRPCQDVRRRSPCRVPSLPRRVGTESVSPRRGRSFSPRPLHSGDTPDRLATDRDVEVTARSSAKSVREIHRQNRDMSTLLSQTTRSFRFEERHMMLGDVPSS